MRGVDAGYIAIMALAIATGLIVRRWVSPPLQIPRWQRFAVTVGAVVGGTVGAKIPWLVMDPEGLLNGRVWLSDGRTITFGLVGGYLGVELAKAAAGVRVKTGDSFAVPLATTIAIGRLGCFWSGCCFGAPTNLAWAVTTDGVARHPTQLLEFTFHLAAAVALYQLGKANRFPRQRVKLYFLAYFVYRFATEWLRPEPKMALGLTLYQWATLAFVPLFLVLWWLDRKPASDLEPEPQTA
ncbi:MAG: prolipoprotein diacylglyceryl transferase family protein [Myxococcota bacterium]